MGRDQDDDGFGQWGGYMNAKVSKLEEQFAQSSDPFRKTNLFAGISIYVNGLTNPSSDELKRIMMENGGVYHHYERKHTTYIIASNLPDVKIRNMNTSKIISPQWILDCLKEKRLLDYTKYLLYTNRKKTQPGLFVSLMKKNESLTDNETSLKNSKHENTSSFVDSSDSNKILTETNDSLNLKLSLESDEFLDLTITDNQINSTENLNKMTYEESTKEQVHENKNEINQIVQDLDILNEKIRLESTKNNSNETISKAQNSSLQNSSKTNINSGVARTANDPKFLSEFYNNSRLHHIATLGASFKQYITQLRDENKSMSFPNRNILKEKLNRKINFTSAATVMHIDMDCFFVSVGLKKYPNLKGKPLAVTHSKGGGETAERPGVDRQLEKDLYMKRLENKLHENIRGEKSDKIKNGFDGKESLSEIASCSYEARKMGIKNGMFVGQALKLCPQLKTIPYDFDGYKEVATSLYNIIAQYTLNIEAVSCDEMFVDLTELLNDVQIEAMDFVTFVRDEVKTKTDCPCSAGIGANRLQARMATKKAKPDGQYFLNPETIEEYMSVIPISELPGVGYSTSQVLKQKNLFTCGDLQNVSLAKIQCEIGKKFGETLYQFCRGIDNKPLVYGQIRKSVSAEVNYGIRFKDNTEMEKFLKQLCGEVHSRLMDTKRKGKCIVLKIMTRAKEAPIETAKFMGHGYCDHQSKSVTLSTFTDSLETITRTVLATMKSLSIEPSELRGIGIQITKLEDLNDGKSNKNNSTLINMFNKVIAKQKEKVNEEMPKIRTDSNTSAPDNIIEVTDNNFSKSNGLKRSPSETNSKLPQHKKNSLRSAKSNIPDTKQNLKQMFEKITSKKPEHFLQYDNIDQSVLCELPENIQHEILNQQKKQKIDYQIKNTKKNNLTETKLLTREKVNQQDDIEIFLQNLDPLLRKEIEQDLIRQRIYSKTSEKKLKTPEKKLKFQKKKFESPRKKSLKSFENNLKLPENEIAIVEVKNDELPTKTNENIFLENNVIELLTMWISSNEKPSENDVDFLRESAALMIRNRKICDIYEPIVEFHKLIKNSINCEWHLIYKKVINSLQSEMKIIYGSRMLLDETINCDRCYQL